MPRRKIRPNLDVDITWDDVNNKPSVITGSGTTNNIPKFTGTDAIGDSSIVDSTNLTFSKNVDFAKYKAIAMACDNGSTLPTSPVIGQWFLHTPSGRKVLMMYDGSSWIPIISLESMTLYVDDANGTDSQDKGYGTGANAFKTIQYAINQIPGQYSGNVYINIASGTYSGFTVQGKYPTGNYYIYINGTLQTNYTGTITSGTTGSVENYCTITVSGAGWTPNQWVGYLAHWNNQTSVIISNTADTLTVVGYSSSTPSGNLTIQSQLTNINTHSYIYCDFVYLQNLYINNISVFFRAATNNVIRYCKIRFNNQGGIYFLNNSYVVMFSNFVLCGGSLYSLIECGDSIISFGNCYINNTGTGLIAIKVYNSGSLYVEYGVLAINGFNTGINAHNNSTLWFYYNDTSRHRITNNSYGIYLTKGAKTVFAEYLYYSGNTTNYYAEASSYAYYG